MTLEKKEKIEFNVSDCLWFCVLSLTPQGASRIPKRMHFWTFETENSLTTTYIEKILFFQIALSGRILSATWWLFG